MPGPSLSRVVALVFAHFVLSCAISWGVIWAFDPDLGGDSWGELITDPAQLTVKFGPTLAGLMMMALFPVAGGFAGMFRRLFDVHKRPRALLAALAIALIAAVAPAMIYIVLANSAVEIPPLSLAALSAALFWVALRTFLGGGLGEELGWRGYALPALLERVGPGAASLGLGLLWTLWHAPAFFQEGSPWWLLAIAQGVLTVSLSFVFTWFYLRTDGSLSVAILLHGALNGFNAFVEKTWIPALDDAGEWQIVRILFILLIGLFAAISLPAKKPIAVSQQAT